MGYQLRRYRLEGVLGFGGFAITYLALDTELSRRLAIKELIPTSFVTRVEGTVVPHTASDENPWEWAKMRFIEEARALAALEHPNILRLYEVFQENGTAYAVTRFEEGGSLESWLQHLGRPPSEAELRGILMPILSALEVVHAHNFLHRDIKPANILLTKDQRPILIDFGSARTIVQARSVPMTAIVTEGYAPFEQYTSQSEQGPWTDLYALGALMYRAITGNRPPESVKRIMAKDEDPCLKLAKAFHGHYSAELLSSIDWALQPKPEMRPQKASEWLEVLNRERPAPRICPARPAGSMPAWEARKSKPTLFSRILEFCASCLPRGWASGVNS
jgi:serine/threonine protein kinase